MMSRSSRIAVTMRVIQRAFRSEISPRWAADMATRTPSRRIALCTAEKASLRFEAGERE
jgi:hypothetical protein